MTLAGPFPCPARRVLAVATTPGASTLNWRQSAARRGEPSSPQALFHPGEFWQGAGAKCRHPVPCRCPLSITPRAAQLRDINPGWGTQEINAPPASLSCERAVRNSAQSQSHSHARCDRGSLADSFARLRGRTAAVSGASAIPAPAHRPGLADPNLLCTDGRSQGSGCSTCRSHRPIPCPLAAP